MKISDYGTQIFLNELSTLSREVATSGGRTYALTGVSLFVIASLVFGESYQALTMHLVQLALATIFVAFTTSLQEKVKPEDALSQHSPRLCLANISEQKPPSPLHEKVKTPECALSTTSDFRRPPKLCLPNILFSEQKPHPQKSRLRAGTIEHKTPDCTPDCTIEPKSPDCKNITEPSTPDRTPRATPRVLSVIDDDTSKTPTPVHMVRASDSTPALTAITTTFVETASTNETTANQEISQVGTLPKSVVSTVMDEVSASLPKNVLGTAEIDEISLDKTTASKRMPKKASYKKPLKTFTGEGTINFLYQNKQWGRIRLSTATEWGESQVFFHRNHLVGDKDILLFHGQSVKVEYLYRRKNQGKFDSLRACRVELASTGPRKSKWTDTRSVASKKQWVPAPKWVPASAPEQKSWRSRSMRRRPLGPPRCPTSRLSPPRSGSKCAPLPSVHVAKGPAVNGQRGFNFRRRVLVC